MVCKPGWQVYQCWQQGNNICFYTIYFQENVHEYMLCALLMSTNTTAAELFISEWLLLLFQQSVMSDSLWPHGLQQVRLSCSSPSPRVCSNSCPSSLWCHPTISSSVAPFASCPQSLPASGSFPMSRLFESGGQSFSFRASASASVLPTNIQGLFPLGLTGLISSRSKGLSRVFSSTTVWKYQFFTLCLFYGPMLTSVHDYWKNHSFNYTNLTYQENWIDHFVSEQTKCLPWLDRFLVSLLRSKRLLLNESVCTVSSIETCWLAEKCHLNLKTICKM